MTITDNSDLLTELADAEAELLAWVRGERSYTNEQMGAETYSVDPSSGELVPDRGLTLVRIAERDAAEIEFASKRVQALRMLTGVSKPRISDEFDDREQVTEWGPSNPNDGDYEYVQVSDCDGSNVSYRRRTPKVVITAGAWEATSEAAYNAASLPPEPDAETGNYHSWDSLDNCVKCRKAHVGYEQAKYEPTCPIKS
jgi:hypothetical protein